MTRRRLSAALMVVTFVLVVAAGPVLYAATVIEEEDAFVAVAQEVTSREEVRQVVAETATLVMVEALTEDDTLTDSLPDGVRTFVVPATRIAAGQLSDAAFAVLDTEPASAAGESALREVHRQFSVDDDEIVIDLRAVLVRTARELGGPSIGAGVAKVVSNSEAGRFTLTEPGSATLSLVQVSRAIPAAGGALGLAALVALIGAVLLAADRRRALVAGGFVVAGAAFSSTVIVSVALFAAMAAATGGSELGFAIADVLATDFGQHQRGVLVNGLVLAAIGLLLGDRPSAVALRALPGDLWHRRPGIADRLAEVARENPAFARCSVWLIAVFALATWSTPTWRVIATIVLLASAAHGFVWTATSDRNEAVRLRQRFDLSPPTNDLPVGRLARWQTNLAIVTLVVFVFWPGWDRSTVVVFLLLGALLQGVLEIPLARRIADLGEPEPLVPSGAPVRRQRRWLAAAAVGLVAIVGGILLTGDATDRVAEAVGCNGHVELCERRVDEVVFAGSHNAMSSSELGWDLALQSGDMVAQLDHGVRALLIDALYWDASGQLDGDGGDAAGASSAVIEAALSDDRPRPGTWLCHGFCALGATELVAGLTDIDVWLDEHPREVLIIIVQDEVSFADLEAAFVASGLRDRAFVHQPGTPFPTLAEMIDLEQRVLVYGENQGTSGEWFQNGYAETFRETPFTFAVRSDFSCAESRGRDDNPLFLINHWLTTGIPVPSSALVVNSRDVLLERVQACEAERGSLPTILAVDFVESGDLVAVVEELNGFAP